MIMIIIIVNLIFKGRAAMIQNTATRDDVDAETGLASRFRAYCESYSHEVTTAQIEDIDIAIHPGVYRAEQASTTATMLQTLKSCQGLRVLDMGCGTGVLGIIAALRGAERVVMADINEAAVANASANVELHRLWRRTEVRNSNLFDALDEERFDLILFNMPFLYSEHSADEAALEAPEHIAGALPPPESFVDVGYQTIRRFLSHARNYLKPNGSIRCTFASFGNFEKLDEILCDCGLSRTTIASRVEKDYELEYLAFEIRPSGG